MKCIVEARTQRAEIRGGVGNRYVTHIEWVVKLVPVDFWGDAFEMAVSDEVAATLAVGEFAIIEIKP